ncbi:Xylose operon regulatory protein [Lignipirellula cremea]|uniref:Xylose operon regulatory protein n=1 Tax=Lignipirellula cremea TaxID=2528010 RepID=A0A518DPQ7_9BACT|nr:Xylose operon regulatory protein [Lignipirellula cremea]
MPPGFKTRRRVALLVETSRSYGRDLLRGIALFARTRSNWSLLHQEMTIDVLLPEWMQESAIHGVIARVDTRTIEPLRRLGVPCVDVRCSRSFPGIPQVETDDQKVAALAFEHLWDRGFRRFAFCGFQFAHYSDARLRFFQKLVVAAGCPLSVYETPGRRDATLSSLEESGVIDAAAMSAWLKSLTSPTGLFVCNDIRGQQVLNACRTLDLAVPDDVAVIGVDDDDAVCPLSDPPLTSVRPDAERAGYRAAEILDAMMNGEPAPARVEYIPPTTVVQRMSTQVMAVEDREVARVCRFIREHACDGIDVNDVTEFTSLSRRQLERRFRTELNRTLHEEITAARLTRVKQLLQETRMTLEQIAPLAGFSHKESLSAVFKRDLGETPGEYRRRIISHGE